MVDNAGPGKVPTFALSTKVTIAGNREFVGGNTPLLPVHGFNDHER